MLGGAAYSYPKDFLSQYSTARMDVVEIDPGVTQLARQYFGLRDDPRLRIYDEDGRIFLNNTEEKYDVIFGDAFSSFYALPFHLTTREAVQKKYDILNDGGVVVVNIISTLEGKGSKFLQAEYKTYQSIFPQVYLFPVQSTVDTGQAQNIILVALKSDKPAPLYNTEDEEMAGYLTHFIQPKISEDIPVLTDDFAPVDNYIMELLEI